MLGVTPSLLKALAPWFPLGDENSCQEWWQGDRQTGRCRAYAAGEVFLRLGGGGALGACRLLVDGVGQGWLDLGVNINLSPLGADSMFLRLSGRGPKSSFEAKDEPRSASLDEDWESNLSRTISRIATRFATNTADRHWEAFREV